MSLIDSEQKSSSKYLLERDNEGMVVISKDNVARVEAMIAENSRYNSSLNQENGTSSKACLEKLKTELYEQHNPNVDTVKDAMRAINRENSTRLSEEELNELAERICRLSSIDLLGYLKTPTTKLGPSGDKYFLVHYLSDATRSYGKRSGRKNYSFATKFCHYSCITFFNGEPEADNFPIIDNVTMKVFPKYYNIKVDFGDYEKYVEAIDSFLNSQKERISRNGLDHLMWYANK